MNINSFYNKYHLKNKNYSKVISLNNFTYFYILKFLQKDVKKGLDFNNVLDIGCGVGTLALFLSQFCNFVKGIDISDRAIKIAENARKNLSINNVQFINDELKQYKEKYDLIICTEVIEHIENENEFLTKVFDNLKDNGKLFISTPSYNNLLYKIGYFNKFDKEVGHLRRYTLGSLTKVLNENGFRVVTSKKSDGILRTILFTSKLGFIIRFIRGPLISIFHLFDNISIKFFGECDIFVIARKK